MGCDNQLVMSSYTAVTGRSLIIASVVFLLTASVAGATYDISFVGIEVDDTEVSVGDTLSYRSNLVNLADGPNTDLTVNGLLVRKSDRNLVFETEVASDIDLASRELHTVEGSHEIPDSVPAGDYEWVLQVETPTGVPVAHMTESVSVSNPNDVASVSFTEGGVYLMIDRVQVGDGIVREFSQPTYGSSGETAIPGRPFDVMFELTNDGDVDMGLTADIEVVSTYDAAAEPVLTTSKDLGTLASGDTQEYNLSASVDEPGTYRVITEVTDQDGTVRAEGEVRLVIGGNGGSIVNVVNEHDTYGSGDTIGVNVSYVGPADGATIVEDATLTARILQDEEEVVTDSYQIDQLPFNVEQHQFTMEAPSELDQYTLEITLGKDGTTYDTFTAEYQALDPDRVLTADGNVRVQGECVDDGTCTRAEYEKGDCFDCRNVDEPPEETSYFNEVDESEIQDPGDEPDDEQTQQDNMAPAWAWIVGGVLALVIVAGILSKRFKEEI